MSVYELSFVDLLPDVHQTHATVTIASATLGLERRFTLLIPEPLSARRGP